MPSGYPRMDSNCDCESSAGRGKANMSLGLLRRMGLAILALGMFVAPRAGAQGLCASADSLKVACTVANVYGPGGLTTNGTTLVAHNFISGQTSPNSFILNVTALSSAVGGQLGVLPLVSPASGISFSFVKSLDRKS